MEKRLLLPTATDVDIQANLESDNATVLMQTATAQVQTPGGNTSCQVRVFFDTGSSRSFVLKSVQEHLNAVSIGNDVLAIARFVAGTRETKVMPRVELQIAKKGR